MKGFIVERVRELCNKEHLSVSDLAKRLGMPQKTVNNYLNHSRGISSDFIINFVDSFGLNANWLLTGEGNMYLADQPTGQSERIARSGDMDNALIRLRSWMNEHNITFKSLGASIDIEEGILKSIFSRGIEPDIDLLQKIGENYPELSLNWVLTGKGNEYLSDLTNEVQSDEQSGSVLSSFHLAESKERGAIPYYADLPVSAGQGGLSEVANIEKPTGYMLIPNIGAESIFPVVGCSMLPKIKSGDLIGVNRVNRWERVEPDKIYMIITAEERMLKRLRIDSDNDNVLWCVSDNYQEFKIYKSEIINIYHVVFHGETL